MTASEIPYIDLHTHRHDDIRGTLRIHSQLWQRDALYDGRWRTCGIHPWDATAYRAAGSPEFDDAQSTFIGECGLDFSRPIHHADDQQAVFRLQLERAAQRQLPVVIHCVRAQRQLLEILREYPLKSIIFHGFTGSPESLREILHAGAYVSFGARTFGSPKSGRSLAETPIERLFLETDDATMPLEDIYVKTAEIRGITLESLKQILYTNFKNITER